jgi:16S rRNA (guanine527-N7)-methyltransferase
MDVSRETYDWPREWRKHLRLMLHGISDHISDETIDVTTTFGEAILADNHLLHLVSQTQPEKEVVKQIVDSAALTRCFSLLPGCRILDVGSGAGFPGIVLKLIFPRIDLVSLDSSPKKIAFQQDICGSLEIDAEFVEGDLRRVALNAAVDIVIVKAVGSHAQIVRRSREWLRSGGMLVFMEGAVPSIAIMRSAAKHSNLSDVHISSYELPEFNSARHLVMIYKK